MLLLDRLEQVYENPDYDDTNLNPLTLAYHDIIGNAAIDIMDPRVLTLDIDWVAISHKLHDYLNEVAQMGTQFRYLIDKYGAKSLYTPSILKSNITSTDKDIMYKLSIKKENFNIDQYLNNIKHGFETQVTKIFEESDDEDDMVENLIQLFEDAFSELLSNPGTYIVKSADKN